MADVPQFDLTNLEEIKKLDPSNVYGSTGMLADQVKQIWQDGKAVQFPDEYKKIENIVISGMGGSAYGAHVVLSLYKDTLSVPLVLNNDYHLPKFTNAKTLVILTTYSGSTEEALNAGEEALRLGAKVTGLTNGGKLGEFLKTNNLPSLIFNPQFNPSGQPRLGTGYILIGTISILTQLGLLSVTDTEIQQAVTHLQQSHEAIKQSAQDLAKKLYDTIPVIFAAEFLEGNAHIMRNQINETAKSFSDFAILPELNHHLMEGLKNPIGKKLTIVFLSSTLYSDILKKRISLTKDVVGKNNVPVVEYLLDAPDKLSQMLQALSLGAYLSLYMGLLYGQNPALIPWVDYFKDQLKK